MQRSFSFQFNVVTFQNLCFDENGLNKMVAKKNLDVARTNRSTLELATKRERDRERGEGGGGGGGGGWLYGYMGGGVVVKFRYITYILIISCNITSC